MVHSLTPPLVPAASTATSTMTTSSRMMKIMSSSVGFQTVQACRQHKHSQQSQAVNPFDRRSISLGLAGLVLGFNTGSQSANAAGKRAPPPPPTEKKDPSVTGVLAKVLASKKRKEALKEAAAKLREKGKPVNSPSE